MKQLMKVAALLAALILTQPASAGVEQQMGTMFGQMANVTEPGAYEDSRRGVIYGGGLTIKNKVMDVQPYSFSAPTLSTSCSGIDGFAGSFSYISKDQLRQMGRSIMSSAATYTFELGLQALCPSCTDRMSRLQELVNGWNQKAINSCEMGKLLVSKSGLDEAAAASMEEYSAQRERLRQDSADDHFDAANREDGSASPAGSLAEEHPERLYDSISGNHIWRALRESGAEEWFVDASAGLTEDLMSLTGTVVTCVPGTDGCAAANEAADRAGEPYARTYAPTLRLEHLVKGSNSYLDAKAYRCNDTTHCLTLVAQPLTLKGMEEQILDLMLGTDRVSGVLGAIQSGSSAREPTPQEQAFLAAGGQYSQIAIALARRNTKAARNFVQDFSEVIASELVLSMLREQLQGVLLALTNFPQDGVRSSRGLVSNALDQAVRDYELVLQRSSARTVMLEHYQQILASLEPPRYDMARGAAGR